MTPPLHVGYIGNFGPPHSTENHVASALRTNGCHVTPLQENDAATWTLLAAAPGAFDLVMWTRTWHLPEFDQAGVLARLREARTPTVGYHLDRWWGLAREHQVADEPFFRCDLVVTADGGHDDRWIDAGVNHLWMPPAVSAPETERCAQTRPEYAHDVVFVGSTHRYHPEWPYRQRLIQWLSRTYRRRLGIYPNSGGAVRGQDLADLYGNAKVVVGDSCLAGGATHYWSDRIPETLGRAGFLVHPRVEGLDDHFTDGEHLALYDIGDFAGLKATIDRYLRDDSARHRIRYAGREHVATHHTYERRMAALLGEIHARGLTRPFRERTGIVTLKRAVDGVVGTFDLRAGHYDGIAVEETWRENVYRLTADDVAGRTVVDIGGNVGAFAVWAAAAGAQVVHAYEPHPEIADALERNLALNGLTDRVKVFREAVGATAGHAFSILGHSGYDGGSYVAGHDALVHEGIEVPVVDLTTVLLRAGEGVVLKVDCEGCEFDIFAPVDGGHLRRCDRIVMEFHGPRMENSAHVTGGASEFGTLVATLAEEGHVETLGRPSIGGSIWWRRYGS